MTPSGHFWGDTLTQQRISVYRLKQPIYLDDDEDLYTTTALPTESTPLLSFTFTPRPGQKENWRYVCPTNWVKNC